MLAVLAVALLSACTMADRSNPYDERFSGLEVGVTVRDGVLRATWDGAKASHIAGIPALEGAGWGIVATVDCAGGCAPIKGLADPASGTWQWKSAWPGGRKTVALTLVARVGAQAFGMGYGRFSGDDFDGDGVLDADCDDGTRDVATCDAHAVCATGSPHNACACATGWTGSGTTCADVDECTTNACGRGSCMNFPGSYGCDCEAGFEQSGGTCQDVDECTAIPCGVGSCTNTVGAYTCACPSGYVSDGVTCVDVDECVTGNGGCDVNATCTNEPGTFVCVCNHGFDGSGLLCDRNECVLDGIDCGPHGACENTVGSYRCVCAAGYALGGPSCVDVDECAASPCGVGVCTNSDGAFLCDCPAGYAFDGRTCADVDECKGMSNCSVDATCLNATGSYECTCNEGWTGDGFSCAAIRCAVDERWDGSACVACGSGNTSPGGYVTQCSDIDECSNGTANCDPNATCVNTVGAFTCTCREDFSGDGVTCRRKPGSLVTKTLAGQIFEFAFVPAGIFLMGSPYSDPVAYQNEEKPQHRVTLTESFLLHRTEATQAQYQAVVGSNPSSFQGEPFADSPSRPVENLTWSEAVAFCDRLSQLEGVSVGTYGLPTEAQWEYAARAGTTTHRYLEPLDLIAWYNVNSNQTRAVKGKECNPWGLCDVLGNVWEWTANWAYGYGELPLTDPVGPETSLLHTARGGAFNCDPYDVRVGIRGFPTSSDRSSTIGFRPRRSLP
jgi:formylglycine-generating enzyme required for sulfatase activity